MRFLSILSFLAATSMAAQVTIHNKCSTAVWLKPDSAGAIGTVSSLLLLSLNKIFFHTDPLLPIPSPFFQAFTSETPFPPSPQQAFHPFPLHLLPLPPN